MFQLWSESRFCTQMPFFAFRTCVRQGLFKKLASDGHIYAWGNSPSSPDDTTINKNQSLIVSINKINKKKNLLINIDWLSQSIKTDNHLQMRINVIDFY